MADKPGDILYHVFWSFGFGPGHEFWDDDAYSDDDLEKPECHLEVFKVRSVRHLPIRGGWPRGVPRSGRKWVTAYEMVNGITVDKNGDWLKNTHILWRRQWAVDARPDEFRPTKGGAYAAALAAARRHSDAHLPEAKVLIARLKSLRTRFKGK